MKKKSKYLRRRAVDCKIIRKSRSNPGYFKYMVTVAEMDGTTSQHPVYGKDMQNALSRLMNQQRTEVIENKMTRNPFIFFMIWLTFMAAPMLLTGHEPNQWYVVYMFIGMAIFISVGVYWSNYLDKGK
tara:strand:- start:501 stop:884 length:384 start_codon:yes stop_codon:yes gene_type:complete